ncbi:unnamed protein product, partial [Polarella glacialis]
TTACGAFFHSSLLTMGIGMEEAEKFQGRKIRGPTLCTQFNDHDFTEPEFFVPSLVASPSPKKKVPDAEKKGHAAKSPQLRDLPPDPKDSLPLRVMAHCAMYSVPNIVGLDEYSYDVAARMAARAEARAVQEVLQGQETAASAPNARPIFKVPKEARQSRGTKEHLVEPGSTGSALILWNSSKVHSTDSGASQLRKRRRKLTDDLLRKMVVNHGDSLGVVSWWFRVFEFYADAPVESVLPALPESRPEDDKPRASLLRRSSSRPQSAGAVERGSENPFTGAQGVSRTRLRQHPGMPQVEKASVDDVKFQEHREELRETRKGLQASGLGYGELDLMRLLRRKKLDSATFEETFAGAQGAPDDGILRLVWRFLDDTGFVDAATCSETRIMRAFQRFCHRNGEWISRRTRMAWLIAAAGKVIEASSGRVQLEVPHGNVIRMVAWSPDGSQIATVGAEGKLRVVDVGRGIVLQVVQLSSEAALCVDWAPCGTKVATGSDDYVLRVVGVATGSVELEVRTGGWVDFALWSPTGATIAVASDDNKLRFISLLNNSSSNNNNSYSNNNNICGTVAHSGRLRRIAWSPRGDLVATVCDDRCLRVCEGESSPRTITTTAATATATTATAATTATLGRIVSESWQESALVALAWSPSGRKVAIGSEGGSVHIVDARSGLPEAGCDFLAPVTDLAWGA